MKAIGRKHGFICTVTVLAVLFGAAAATAYTTTITGTVMDGYIIGDDDGEYYEIVETDKGNALLENVGKRVEVRGEVKDEEGFKIMTVAGFSLLVE